MKNLGARLAFFKQSGWMVLATGLGGVLMYAVHIPASRIGVAEYGVLVMLLQVLNQMGIPTQGLQTTFAQQAVGADSEAGRRQMRSTVQGVLTGTFLIWVVLGLLTLWRQAGLLETYKIVHPAALWFTILLGLVALWNPIVAGLLQGRQNFLWLGNQFILNAGGRLLFVTLIVLGGSVFLSGDVRDLPLLAAKLRQPSDPVSLHLRDQLSEGTRGLLASYNPADRDSAPLQTALVQDLNRVLRGPSLYEAQRFSGIVLRSKTQRLLASAPRGGSLLRLNRLLLEDAYRLELSRTLPGLGFGHSAGAMAGIVFSMLGAMLICGWQVREYVFGPRDPFAWKPWLRRVLPLTLGLGASTFMFTEDMIVVQKYFSSDMGLYGAAGMIGRALVFLVAPMTYVMFPKIVQSAAREEKTSVMWQALGVTALLGVASAGFVTLFPKLPLQIIQGSKYLGAAPLVPWFAWCMLPLTLASVLLNNLLARGHYQAVPWLVAVAAAYFVTLQCRHESFVGVIQTLGLFAALFLAVCIGFTWRAARRTAAPAPR